MKPDCVDCGHAYSMHDTGWDASGCMTKVCTCRNYTTDAISLLKEARYKNSELCVLAAALERERDVARAEVERLRTLLLRFSTAYRLLQPGLIHSALLNEVDSALRGR